LGEKEQGGNRKAKNKRKCPRQSEREIKREEGGGVVAKSCK